MTKARDLANLISGGFNSDKIPNLDASKITSGTLADARFPSTLPAINGANLTGIEGTATGTIVSWSTASIPSGFLECDGTAVSRSTYSALFTAIGTTYGSGDGSSTFNLPNLADNVPVGKSNNKSLASTGGANTVTPTGNISGSTANASLSTAQLASHSHSFDISNPGGNPSPNTPYAGVASIGGSRSTNNAGSGSAHSHNMSANFSGSSTSIVQPYLTVIYIIKT